MVTTKRAIVKEDQDREKGRERSQSASPPKGLSPHIVDGQIIPLICFNFLGPCVDNLQYWNSNRSSKHTHETRGAPRSRSSLNESFHVLRHFRLGTTRAGFGF